MQSLEWPHWVEMQLGKRFIGCVKIPQRSPLHGESAWESLMRLKFRMIKINKYKKYFLLLQCYSSVVWLNLAIIITTTTTTTTTQYVWFTSWWWVDSESTHFLMCNRPGLTWENTPGFPLNTHMKDFCGRYRIVHNDCMDSSAKASIQLKRLRVKTKTELREYGNLRI